MNETTPTVKRRLSRRRFIATSVAAGAAASVWPGGASRAAEQAANRIVLAAAGVGGRGPELIGKFTALPGVEFKYVIDPDQRAVAKAAAHAEKKQGFTPRTEADFRRALEDTDVDALIIATPDHWHAPMATLAVRAGKHVYVEKPCSHNPREGEILVEAARRNNRFVQMGSQRRSIGNVQQMTQELRDGVIGNVFLAKCFYARRRPPIGFGNTVEPPAALDWDLWQGPAPRTAYRDNVHPYNWHWFWTWGTGEALNNGVHLLDVARWGMGVDFPTRARSFGGRWHDVGLDDWETPDTQEIHLEFGPNRGISWFGRSCSTYGDPGYRTSGILFFGSGGLIDYDGSGSYTVYDLENEPVRTVGGNSDQKTDLTNSADPGLEDHHAQNFIETIRGNADLTAPINEGHCSTVLGQLGNIAHRVDRALTIDPSNGHILADPEAAQLWTREYEPGWEPLA